MFVLKSKYDKTIAQLDQRHREHETLLENYYQLLEQKPAVVVKKHVDHHRLNMDQYLALMKNIPQAGVPTSDLDAGFRLGVEYLARKLREGFVVGE